MKIFNAHQNSLVKEFTKIHRHKILDLAIVEDNSKILSCDESTNIYFWDVVKESVIKQFIGHSAVS